MKKTRFWTMTESEFKAYSPKNQAEAEAKAEEDEYREYCKDQELDPLDERSREDYEIVQREMDPWEDMDDDEREGWSDNIIRSFDD